MKQSPKPGLEEIVARVENEEETENKPINRQSIRELWLSRLRLFFLYKDAWKNFREQSILSKIAYISEYPFTYLRDLSCPIVHEDRWNKYWILGSSFGAPFLIAFFADSTIIYSFLL